MHWKEWNSCGGARRHVIAIWLLVISIFALASCSRSAGYYVASGDRYFKKQAYAEAALQFRNAIQKDPSSVEAHFGLARAQMAQNQMGPAIANLQFVLRQQPGHLEALRSLGDTCLRILLAGQGQSKEARKLLQSITDKLSELDRNSLDSVRFRGHLAMLDGNSAEALKLFTQADRLSPGQPQLQLALAAAMVQQNMPEQAEKLAQAIIEADKSYGPAYDFLQLRYLAQGKSNEAAQMLKRKAELNPNIVEFQLQLAGHYLLMNRPTFAQPIFRRLLSDRERFPDARLMIGDLYLRLHRNREAIDLFDDGIRLDPARSIPYKMRLSNIYWNDGRRKEALTLSTEVVRAVPNDLLALELHASQLLEGGTREDLGEVIAAYTELSRRSSKNPVFPYQLGRTHLRMGQVEQAVSQFQESINRDRSFLPPRLSMAEIQATRGRHEEALRVLAEAASIDSKNSAIRVLRAAALRNLQRFDEAKNELGALLRDDPHNRNAQIELGLLALAAGRLNEAESVFAKLYSAGQQDLRPASGLVRVYVAQKRFDKAIQLLQSEVTDSKESESARETLASLALSTGAVELALHQLRSIVQLNPSNAEAYVRIGQILGRQGKLDDAVNSVRRAYDVAPKNINVLLAYAAILQDAGRLEDARRILERAHELDPANPLVLNNLAYLLAETGKDLDKALLLARMATESRPANTQFQDTLGMVYFRHNMVDHAIDLLKSLVQAEPKSPIYRMHYGMALMGKGDYALARNEFLASLAADNNRMLEKQLRDLLASAEAHSNSPR